VRSKRNRNYLLLLLFILLGAFVGNVLGELLAQYFPGLAESASLGVSPANFQLLNVAEITLGGSIHFNILGALGAFLCIVLWWRH